MSEEQFDDRPPGESYHRRPVVWCARCRRPNKTLVYLSDTQHYCWDCAVQMHRTRGLRAAGRRAEDIIPWE